MFYREIFPEEEAARSIAAIQEQYQSRIDTNHRRVEQGLAKLVLTVIEMIRRLLESQALLRMEHGSLSAEEIEELGLTFMKLEEKIRELTNIFGLQADDLNINLGPLGKLL